MEPVLFYGVPLGCSFGAIVTLEWSGRPYRLCRIEMPRDLHSELFGRVNPLRETPALLTAAGDLLNQSAAIAQHLASPGGPDQDRLNQALAFLTTSYFGAFSPLWAAFEMQPDPPVQEMLRAQGRRRVAKAHGQLEALLAGRDWLAGARPSAADAYFAGIVRWNAFHEAVDLADYPRATALAAKLQADPAVVFAQAIEDQRPATGAGGFLGHVALEDLAPRLAA